MSVLAARLCAPTIVLALLIGAHASGAAPAPDEAPHLTASVQTSTSDTNINLRLRYGQADAADRPELARMIGERRERVFDYASARIWYELAAKQPPGNGAVAAQLGLARLELLTDPTASMVRIATLRRAYPRLAAALQIEGRLVLSRGNAGAAISHLRDAQAIAARSDDRDSSDTSQSAFADLSFAASRAGDAALAAQYAAASGLGAEPNRPSTPTKSQYVLCDPAAGLRRDDSAVFDVALSDTRATNVALVWSARSDANIARLGNSLYEWRWKPGQSDVLRRGFRVMLACSATGTGLPWSTASSVEERLADWLVSKQLRPARPRTLQSPDRAAAVLAELEAREKADGTNSPQLLPLLIMIIDEPVLPPGARSKYSDRLLEIMAIADAPVDLQAAVALMVTDNTPDHSARLRTRLATVFSRAKSEAEQQGLVEHRYALARRLLVADSVAGRETLQAMLALPPAILRPQSKFHRLATEALADVNDPDGPIPAAVRRHLANGATPQDCNRADARVSVSSITIREDDYPAAARQVALAGYVMVQPSFDGDGKLAVSRIIYAQPPGIFDAVSLQPFAGKRTKAAPLLDGKPFACDAGPAAIKWEPESWKRE